MLSAAFTSAVVIQMRPLGQLLAPLRRVTTRCHGSAPTRAQGGARLLRVLVAPTDFLPMDSIAFTTQIKYPVRVHCAPSNQRPRLWSRVRTHASRSRAAFQDAASRDARRAGTVRVDGRRCCKLDGPLGSVSYGVLLLPLRLTLLFWLLLNCSMLSGAPSSNEREQMLIAPSARSSSRSDAKPAPSYSDATTEASPLLSGGGMRTPSPHEAYENV